MKRFILLTILLASVVFLVPTYAGKPTPGPQQVEVVNAPENSVPIQGAVEVTNTNENAVPVTVTNPSTGDATIKGIGQQNFTVASPTVGTKYDLVRISGPGSFVSASLVTAGHPSVVGDVDIELVIDGNIIFSDRLQTLAQIYEEANPFGITVSIKGAGYGVATMGFQLSVSFENSVVLSATTHALNSLTGTVIYGE